MVSVKTLPGFDGKEVSTHSHIHQAHMFATVRTVYSSTPMTPLLVSQLFFEKRNHRVVSIDDKIKLTGYAYSY